MFHSMHPMFGRSWNVAHAYAGCCTPSEAAETQQHEMTPGHEGGPWGGGPYGVRMPLRFLAYKLDLDDAQVRRLAEILDELKTERAQAAVDDRRSLTTFADAFSGEGFDAEKAAAGAALRNESVARIGKVVVHALERIHAILRPEQRERFAYLIRTGVVAL